MRNRACVILVGVRDQEVRRLILLDVCGLYTVLFEVTYTSKHMKSAIITL